MNKTGNTIRQPYEIIETSEEIITRYFNPNFCTTERTHISQRGNSHQSPERPEQNKSERDEIVRNSQFQDLLERFKKLRLVMSQLTQRFEEINLIKAQVVNKFSTFNSVNGDDELGDNEIKIPENNTDFESGALPVKLVSDEVEDGLQNCNSRASQTILFESMLPAIKQVNGFERIYQGWYGDKQDPSTFHCSSKSSEAALLKKSKKLLINLIDKELEKAQSCENRKSNVSVNVPVSLSNSVQRKMGCINKIKGELNILKDLEGIDG